MREDGTAVELTGGTADASSNLVLEFPSDDALRAWAAEDPSTDARAGFTSVGYLELGVSAAERLALIDVVAVTSNMSWLLSRSRSIRTQLTRIATEAGADLLFFDRGEEQLEVIAPVAGWATAADRSLFASSKHRILDVDDWFRHFVQISDTPRGSC